MSSRNEQRDAYLRGLVEPVESIVSAGPAALVTDRRILFGWRLAWPPHAGEWTHDSLTFDEITWWREGRSHDERPLLRLGHPPHPRLEQVPARRFLLFRWGNATASVSHQETRFFFKGRRDPVFRAMKERLELSGAAQGEPFVEVLPGTREDRIGRSRGVAVLQVSGPRGIVIKTGRRFSNLDERLHHGQLAWRVRLPSWLLLAVPAWFINPWLVLPAVVLAEVAWVVGLQWSWHHDRRRRAARQQFR
jgi:hypothetical protein